MTEPSPPGTGAVDPTAPDPDQAAPQDRFARLPDRPVAEHVEVFEDEHARLRRRLGAIDPI